MTDDLLWLPFVILQYIDETADYKILSIKEPYYDNKNKKDTLFDHSVAAIEKVSVSYTHLRAHETVLALVCRLLLDN